MLRRVIIAFGLLGLSYSVPAQAQHLTSALAGIGPRFLNVRTFIAPHDGEEADQAFGQTLMGPILQKAGH